MRTCILLPCCAILTQHSSCICIMVCLQSEAALSFNLDTCILSAAHLIALQPLILSSKPTAFFLSCKTKPFFPPDIATILLAHQNHPSKRMPLKVCTSVHYSSFFYSHMVIYLLIMTLSTSKDGHVGLSHFSYHKAETEQWIPRELDGD